MRLRAPESRRAELARAAVDVTDAEVPGGADAVFGDLRHAEWILWPLLPDVEVLDPPVLRALLQLLQRGRTGRRRSSIPVGTW